MLEREKKIMLNEKEYNILSAKYNSVPIITQKNYYFDTDDLSLNKKGITCRIRAKNGTYISTIKNHNMFDGEVSLEENFGESKEFDARVFYALGLRNQGMLVTNRRILYKDFSCEISMDKNTYLGHSDFELEAEYAEGCESKAIYLLNNLSDILIFWHVLNNKYEFLLRAKEGKSKSERFFEYKRKLNIDNEVL